MLALGRPIRMNLYLRLFFALAGAWFDEKRHHRTASLKTFRVWPHDLDALGHMNNGRYLQIMDVARVDWMARVGVAQCMWRNKWSAVIGSGIIRYRFALKPFQCYQVRTRLLYWDSRWWYLEHVFIDTSGRQVAVGVSKAGIRNGRQWVATSAMVSELSPGAEPPKPPAYLYRWLEIEDQLFAHAGSAAEEVEDSTEPSLVAASGVGNEW